MANETKKPKILLGNNITAKAKSATFWTGMIPVLATFIVSVLSLCGVNVAEDIVNQYTAVATTIISILSAFGILVSHDTKGVSDSGIVQTYSKPRDQEKDPLVFKSDVVGKDELGIKTPEEFDTTQPFTDSSDEQVMSNVSVDVDPSVKVDSDKPLGATASETVDTTNNTDSSVDSSAPVSEGGGK